MLRIPARIGTQLLACELAHPHGVHHEAQRGPWSVLSVRRVEKLTMAGLAVAWVLANPNVASAIVGASRPEQLDDSVAAAGVRLDAETLAAIDGVLGGLVETDPSHTQSPTTRP